MNKLSVSILLLFLLVLPLSFAGIDRDFFVEIEKGNVPGHSTVHKFGANTAVGATIVPIANGGFYRTPKTAIPLEIVSSSVQDDNDTGIGARVVRITGLNASWDEVSVDVAMNGTTARKIDTPFLRVYRMFVLQGGQYTNQTSPSQIGTITLRQQSNSNTWAVMRQLDTNFGSGQSLIGAYTVPAGKTAYILSSTVAVDSTKTADLFFFARRNANDTTAPYDGTLRIQNVYVGAESIHELIHKTYEKYPEKTDIGFMAQAATTADVSVEFELLLVDNDLTENLYAQEVSNLSFGVMFVIVFVVLFYLITLFLMRDQVFAEHGLIKVGILTLTYWLMLLPLRMAISYNDNIGGPASVSSLIDTLYIVSIYINIAITFYMIVYFIVSFVRSIQENVQKN